MQKFFPDEPQRFFVPSWIMKVLARSAPEVRQAGVAAVLSLELLSKHVSTEDIVGLIHLNEHNADIFGVNEKSILADHWQTAWNVLYHQYEAKARTEEKVVFERLTGEEFKQPDFVRTEVPGRANLALAVVVYPGQLGGEDLLRKQRESRRTYLCNLYEAAQLHTVADTPAFSAMVEDC